MGIGTSLKDLYYHLEDRYYEILDKINSKIPIYKITDPIDKVIPSFALLLLIIAILIVYFVLNLFPLYAVKEGVFTLNVVDPEENALEGAVVEIDYAGETHEFATDSSGGIGEFKVIVGTQIDRLSVRMQGFKLKFPASTEMFNIPITEERVSQKFIFEEIITTKEVSFNIVDSDTQQLLRGKTVSLSFECSNRGVESPAPMTTTNGTATVIVSKECGVLTADIVALGYKKKVRVPITDGGTIFLQEEEPEPPEEIYGKIIVDLYFKGERVTDQEITVSLYRAVEDAQDDIKVASRITSSGQVLFEELSAGRYIVKSEATQGLTGEESGVIFVNAADRKSITLYLKERIVGQIKLRVIDEASKQPIKDARVTMKEGQQEVESDFTDGNGEKVFFLKKDIPYNIIIDKERYCLKRLVDIKKGDDVKEIKLRKYTGLASQCGGALIARVKDNFGKPIQGAVAMLFDEDGYFLGTQRTTDANGEAKFTGIDNGKYKVFAYRGYGNGWSDTLQYSVREGMEIIFNVTITVQKGTINVRVVDEDNEPLQYSFITMNDAINDQKIEGPVIVEREDAVYSFEAVAGDPVFFYIQKDGYSTLVSEPIIVQPNAVKDVNFTLETMRISGEIQAEFLGLFKNERVVSIVGAGEEYTAKFRLSMPENAAYNRVGIHVRTGYKNKMELDQIYIKEESVPGKPSIVRGTSYNPGEGINYDSQYLSADGSKWMNFEWGNYTKGLIYLEFVIKVRETARADSELPIFWRAWAKKGTKIIRDPTDVSLGSSETAQDLYAEAYKKTYQTGVETLCTDKWCFSVKILDIEEDLSEFVDDAYSAKAGKFYKLDFSILNNSTSETDEFHDVKLKVWNPEDTVDLGEYSFSGELSIEGVAEGSETPNVEIGDLPINREVKGTIYFTPIASISSSLLIRLHDPHLHAHIFEKQISLDIAAAEEFTLLFESGGEFTEEPPLLPSGVENELKVKVLRLRDGLEIENAVVKLQNKFGDTLSQTTTTSLAIATLTIPILMPGEKLIIVVEKPDYQALEKEITVDSSLLEIDPEKIGFNLNVVEDLPDSQVVTLTNLTELGLKLESVELQGEFDGLVDEEKAYEWLYSEYFGKEISPKGSLDIAAKLELSDLGLLAEEGRTLEGKLNFTVSALGESWVFSADVIVSIGLGGEADDPNCFSLDKESWEATIQTQEAATDFMVINACTVNGKPIELKNLSARIEWKSNHLGDFWVKIQDIAIQLYGNYPRIIRGIVEKESAVEGMFSFIPDSGIVGAAEATITVSAEHPTTGGKQVLSDSMDVSIKIVNMAGCLRFSKDLIKMMEGEEESFSIEATENCGGKVDIRLDTDLTVSQKEFSINQGETKEITVLAETNYPGQYPIYIFAKGPGLREYSFTKLIRVIIDTDGCIKLNKYEYDIFDCESDPYDGFDIGKIINVCHSKVVSAEVSFDEKDLWEAFVNAWPWALVGFLYGGVQAMSEGKTFWGTDKPSTICTNAGYEYCGNKMICKNEKIKKVEHVICCASECITSDKGKDLRDELCENRGLKHCPTGKCVGELVPVKGIYCCRGQCQEEFEYSAFKAICENYDYDYCKEEEQCSADFTWVEEGIRCCMGECRTPEQTPQMMVCEEYGMIFCNEKDGWYCPAGGEEIIEEKHLKCCTAEECERAEEKEEQEDICEEEETCEGTVIVEEETTYCDEPCTPPTPEMTAEDEICKTEDPNYDHCEQGTECLYSSIEVEGVECCIHLCIDITNADFYDQLCVENGAIGFCDGVTEKCPLGEESFIDAEELIGVPCCNVECESLFVPPEEPEETLDEMDILCKDESIGGNWQYDYCKPTEDCINNNYTHVQETQCCRFKCIDRTKENEYEQYCRELYGGSADYCDYTIEECEIASQVVVEEEGEFIGLPCCTTTCKLKGAPGPEDEMDALCKDESIGGNWQYDYCKPTEDCINNNYTYVQETQCCRFKCIDRTRESEYEDYCRSQDYADWCDHVNDECSIESQVILGVEEGEYTGLECCTTNCKLKGAPGTEDEMDALCKDESIGGMWRYDYCKANEDCITMNMTVQGIDCCPYKCIDRTKESEYEDYCRSQDYADWCDHVNDECAVDAQVIIPLGEEYAGLECCTRACTGSAQPPECVEGQVAPGAVVECRAESYDYIWIKKLHADCSEFYDKYEECAAGTKCKNGECKGNTEICAGYGYTHCNWETQTCKQQTCGTACIDYRTGVNEGIQCCSPPGQCITTAGAIGPSEEGVPVMMAGLLAIEGAEEMPVAMAGLLDIGGNLMGSIGDAINAFIGINNPWEGLILGWLAGTVYNYMFEQEVGSFPYITTVTDLKILWVDLVIPAGLEEIEETLINVTLMEESIHSTPDWPLGEQEIEIVFENQGIEQEDPYKPIFRTLKVGGEKYDYNTQFDVKKKEDAENLAKGEFLEIKTAEGFTEKFHLQFNAYCPVDLEPEPIEEVSCMIDGMTGTTGPDALPKVLLRWDWSNVKDNTCDEDGGGIFCDATQLSIELLKKIHMVDELLRHQVFACPTSEGILTEKTQELSEDDLDVGLTRVRIEKAGKNAKVIGTIESNNGVEMTVNAVVSLENEETGEIIECPEAMEKSVQVTSRSEVDCTFNDLDDGLYRASIEINPQLATCKTECKNIETGNDSIETMLIVGGEGLFEKCEPYSTSRLAEYAAANPQNSNLKQAVELTNFKANLIMDGYTNDFRNDFHDFAMTKDFFNTPSYYKGDAGLWKYFSNAELLEFKSSFLRPESGYLRSGKYQIRIIIDYNDDSWSLFREGEPNAKISVKFDRLIHPEPDSPFYYMPFDGLVGVDTENGRQGYGVNYRQESLEEIKINEDSKQLIRTSTIAPSTPIPGGWIYTAKSENFRTLNNDRRGILLDVERSSSESSIILSPSNATPVMLKVAGGAMERAWAFYSLTINGEPQIIGPYLTSWTGVARGCRDFSDRETVENFTNRKDVHGGVTRDHACAPVQRKSDYGLEWCDVKRKGSVFLKTVFFTPQGTESVLEMVDSQDSAVFIAPGTTGSQKVYLNGVYEGSIDSVEKVFELVKTENVCVAGVGNSAKMAFFWNPKVIIDNSLLPHIESAANECIPPK